MIFKSYISFRSKVIFTALLILIFLIAVLSFLYFKQHYTKYNENKYDFLIESIARKYNLSPFFLKAIIWRESKFYSSSTGTKGEIGLMQIMPGAAAKDWENYNKRNISNSGILYNPGLNIEIGSWYITRCKRHWINYKDCLAITLAEYNAGYSNVKKWIKGMKSKKEDFVDRIGFPSTKKYVKSVLKKYNYYKKN